MLIELQSAQSPRDPASWAVTDRDALTPACVAVGVRHDPPWVDLGGSVPVGCDVAALGWIADRMDMDLRWVQLATSSVAPLRGGRIDLVASIRDRELAPSGLRGISVDLDGYTCRNVNRVWLVRSDWPWAGRMATLAGIYRRLKRMRRYA